jgi:hypothetical protein
MSAEIPNFKTYDEYCVHLQESLRNELQELGFLMAGNKQGLKVLADRIDELNKSIASLKAETVKIERR